MKSLPDAVYNAMIDGLTQLHLLRLPSAPPAKGLEAVACVWETALMARVEWSADDAQRLTASFAQVASTAERWPLPIDVISQLPPRPPAPALPQPETVPCPPHIAAELGFLMAEMIINRDEKDYEKL